MILFGGAWMLVTAEGSQGPELYNWFEGLI